MKRVMFVDDEPRVLDGLRRMLHKQRNDWDMVFVNSGQEALRELEGSRFDVLVSDMRMPQMDGAALLTQVQKRYPAVVRIVLSGHSDMEAALRAVPVAHQFLAKPCNPETLVEVIRRASGLQELLIDGNLRETIGRIKHLPSFPRTYHALVSALANPNVAMKDIAAIVEKDAGLCAKLLQLVNSAFFGLPRRVTNMQTAVSLLGTKMVKNVVLSLEVFQGGPTCNKFYSTETLQRHCFFTGTIAKSLLTDSHESEDAFIAGILHDIGELILVSGFPDKFESLVRRSSETGEERYRIENEEFHVSHPVVGAYLLGLWGLPYSVVEAVAHHHEPKAVEGVHIPVLAAVHVADKLLQEGAMGDQGPAAEVTIDPQCMEALGGAEHLPEWRAMVEKQFSAIQEESKSGT
jgi:putative nucleotidyltransferase with HDIG domain